MYLPVPGFEPTSSASLDDEESVSVLGDVLEMLVILKV